MVKKVDSVVLDSNVLLSAIVFGGKPFDVFSLVLNEFIEGVTSRYLITELIDVLGKKFSISSIDLDLIEQEIKEIFVLVQPKEEIHVVRDESDNKVLEAAIEGHCNYIITGDKDLLSLSMYKGIKIITVSQFLKTR